MDSNTVKTSDKKMICETIRSRFITEKIYIKTTDINIQVESFLFENGVIEVTFPCDIEIINNVIFYRRDKEEVIFSHAAFKQKREDGALIFDPLDIQILQIPRKEERKRIATIDKSGIPSVYISNIISDFTIDECLNLSGRRVDFIKNDLLEKFKKSYPDSEIVFLNGKVKDQRMIYFINKRKPFFIKSINDVNDIEKLRNDEDLKYYNSFIHQIEPLDKKLKIVSEICVPLLYKLLMPFGYVKTVSYYPLKDEDFLLIRKFGMSASTVFTNDKKIIKSSDENIAITDLSMKGLGIFFKNKVLIKHFKENSLILFTIFLPEEKKTTMLCIVRNITLIKNYIYRIGCEILNIEAIGEVYYSEFIESLKTK